MAPVGSATAVTLEGSNVSTRSAMPGKDTAGALTGKGNAVAGSKFAGLSPMSCPFAASGNGDGTRGLYSRHVNLEPGYLAGAWRLVERLYTAMNSVDSSSGLTRGLILLE